MAPRKIGIVTPPRRQRPSVVAAGNARQLTEIRPFLAELYPRVRFMALSQLWAIFGIEKTAAFLENAIINLSRGRRDGAHNDCQTIQA